ncbi:hypothetical protein [Flavobacterium sp. 316]|uniref:DUF6892 domain-containing protein n=1 Tax=Flavobacterium sp. 316 TaxID=1603293 RepID=UPI000695F491|nr:hypothetical protein [Flavobacterium sp. 316]
MSKLKIQCNDDLILINDTQIEFPIHLNTLIEILGPSSPRVYENARWHATWDNLGICVDYVSWDKIYKLRFVVAKQENKQPENLFIGDFFVNNKSIFEKDDRVIYFKKYQINRLMNEGENIIHSIDIMHNFRYKEEIPQNKYVILAIDEEIIEFTDFGFKLAIIQELMYERNLLKPKFDLREFVDWYQPRKINLEKEGYEPIPEVDQYFKELRIPKKLARKITQIYQDGGNEIYLNLLCYGNGDETFWDIKNTEDIKQFPNLKKMDLCYVSDEAYQEFKKMNIDLT